MMYHIVICDDEKEMLNRIGGTIKERFIGLNIMADYIFLSDSRELISFIEEHAIDILFLDIDMPYFNGMEAARLITEKGLDTLLVFVTGYDSLVYQTFEYRPFGFIRKSFFADEIDGVITRLVNELIKRNEHLTIKNGRDIIKIPFSDIIYVESEGNYVNISAKNGKERCRDTLLNIEKELSGREFIRCHKGYLVNSKYIKRINSNRIELTNTDVIPIGRSYEKEIRQKLLWSMRV